MLTVGGAQTRYNLPGHVSALVEQDRRDVATFFHDSADPVGIFPDVDHEDFQPLPR